MSGSTSYATLDDYVLNFREDLDSAAKSCLAGLGVKITEEGDDWLDAHLEAIFNTSSTGAILEHLKTPSRTATAKKTRAKLEADKQRTDKIKSVNARLALSPSKSTNESPARLLFQPLGQNGNYNRNQSPLLPRLINGNVASPSPMKPRLVTKGKDKVQSPIVAKKGKGQQENENSAPSPAQRANLRSPLTRAIARGAMSPSNTSPTRPAKSPLRQIASPTRSKPVSRPQSPKPMQNTSRPPSRAATSSSQSRPTVKDLSMIAEAASERSIASASARNLESVAKSPARVRPLSPRLAQQQQARSPRSPPRQDPTQQPSIDAVLRPSAPVLASAPTPAPAPVVAAPIRQVRSSWLSKALGSGPSTSSNSETNSNYRKSVVSQSRPTLHDYAGLRQSLAPPGGLKRKSDQGIDEDEDEAPRPEKITKVETAPIPAKPSMERQPSLPVVPAAVEPPSEILKITKALAEIRKGTQAKELAKQKAAAAAREPASGFFKGLTKSLGLGVGGRVESPEDEAERLARELEEDRQAEAEAQAELDRLMSGGDAKVEKKDEGKAAPAEVRTTTPTISPPAVVENQQGSDKTEEEEEEEMVEEISMAEIEVESDYEPEQEPVVPAPRQMATALPPRLQTPPKLASIRLSTTPTTTPPVHLTKALGRGTASQGGLANSLRSPQPKATTSQLAQPLATKVSATVVHVQAPITKPAPVDDEPIEIDDDTADEEEDEDDEDYADQDQENVTEHVKPSLQAKTKAQKAPTAVNNTGKLVKSTSTASLASLAPSHGLLNHATTIANKTIGVKPTTAPVKSVQLAQAAAKKEQDANARKQNFREQAEARKQDAIRRKAEEEKTRVAEQERIRMQEIEKGNKLRAELERKKAERGPIMAQAMKSQDDRAKREAAAAKAKVAEEELARKRKMAPTLNKSTTVHPAKKPQPGSNNIASSTNGRETFRPTSSMKGPIPTNSNSGPSGPGKLGPTSFRIAPPPPTSSMPSSSSTIKLVNTAPAVPAHLGPPSRPSGMMNTNTHPHPQWSHVPTGAGPSNVLQQQRVALQSQLDEKALGTQSEDIVLPDINSEYSDSDDSEKSTDFKRPDWAESPELRAALERQATRNPDELFGPIKPISMEELFKVKIGKFRPRSSSANWANGDGVTKKEEVDYAKRMGFRGPGGRGEGSSGSGL